MKRTTVVPSSEVSMTKPGAKDKGSSADSSFAGPSHSGSIGGSFSGGSGGSGGGVRPLPLAALLSRDAGGTHHAGVSTTTSADRCWFTFLLSAFTALLLTAIAVIVLLSVTRANSISPATGGIVPHSFYYFFFCAVGGGVAGLAHYALTPLDLVKCRMQVGLYTTMREGLVRIAQAEGGGRPLRSLVALYRGGVPTLAGYFQQGAVKFGLYELLKHAWGTSRSAGGAPSVAVMLAASFTAELAADVALAPWEAVKIQMQTSLAPASVRTTMTSMWAQGGLREFFAGLPPLWCRQIPYTMMKFASFEKIVAALQAVVLALQARDAPRRGGPPALSSAAKLLLSLLAGLLAGVLCAVVSHPPDTLLSAMNKDPHGGVSAAAALRGVGGVAGLWKGLVPRMVMVASITALQWVIYDSFKVYVGLPTTGSVAAAAASPLGVVPHPKRS